MRKLPSGPLQYTNRRRTLGRACIILVGKVHADHCISGQINPAFTIASLGLISLCSGVDTLVCIFMYPTRQPDQTPRGKPSGKEGTKTRARNSRCLLSTGGLHAICLRCRVYGAVTNCPMWPLGYRASDVISRNFGDGMKVRLSLNGGELVQTHPIIFIIIEQAMGSWRRLVLVATKSGPVVSQALFILRIATPDSRLRHCICEVQGPVAPCSTKTRGVC
jgi:hypothetical protein